VVAVYVVQLVMFGLGKAATSLEWLLSMTFFSCYKPQKMTSMFVADGPAAPWSVTMVPSECAMPALFYPAILLGLGFCFYLAATMIFTRRDLPAPL
jgi:ABC-2 type transport system permease protein